MSSHSLGRQCSKSSPKASMSLLYDSVPINSLNIDVRRIAEPLSHSFNGLRFI